MGLHLPEHFLFFQVQNIQLAFEVSESEAHMRGRTSCEAARFDAFRMFDRRYNFELSLGELRDLDQTSCLGALPTGDKLTSVGDPLDIVWSVVDAPVEVLHNLRRLDSVHLKTFKL